MIFSKIWDYKKNIFQNLVHKTKYYKNIKYTNKNPIEKTKIIYKYLNKYPKSSQKKLNPSK